MSPVVTRPQTGIGTKKVKIFGKPAVAGSKMATSRGDEAGAAQKKGLITSKRSGAVRHGARAMDVKVEGAGVVSPLATGHVVNAAPPVPCGNPACRFHEHPIPASQTARLPTHVQVDFPNRLVCLECYRSLVGGQPLPAGSNVAAPFIPGGSVLSAAMGGVGQLRGSVGA